MGVSKSWFLQIVGCSARTSVNCGVVSDILTSFPFEVCRGVHGIVGRNIIAWRLSQAIREEIETILEGELGDPRIWLASVSSVLMADARASARVDGHRGRQRGRDRNARWKG